MSQYLDQGYEIITLLNGAEFKQLKNYSLEMLSTLFKKYGVSDLSEARLREYHRWGSAANVPHGSLLQASNRHSIPPEPIKRLLVNDVLSRFLKQIGICQFKIWDEGLGWLGFRLIRPGCGDGYPFSCKNWGPAKNVLSIWLPIVGFSTEIMLNLIPKSHLKDYPKYLPKESKFAANEYRLDYQPLPQECMRPTLRVGQALIFHPKILHSEEVIHGEETRFNLEFRIIPGVIEKSGIERGGSLDFLAGARDIAKGKARSEDKKSKEKPTLLQTRFFSHERYKSL